MFCGNKELFNTQINYILENKKAYSTWNTPIVLTTACFTAGVHEMS